MISYRKDNLEGIHLRVTAQYPILEVIGLLQYSQGLLEMPENQELYYDNL